MSVHPHELGDILESNPQALIGKVYTGVVTPIQDDGGVFVIYGDWIIVLDFDSTILEVIHDLEWELLHDA